MSVKEQTDKLVAVTGPIGQTIDEVSQWVDDATDDKTIEIAEIAAALLHVKEAHAELDRVAKKLYHVKDKLEKHSLPSRMEEMDIDMLRVPGLGRSFSIQNKMSASFIDKEKGFEWLRSTGQGDIIQETVNAGTLTSFVRNLIIEEGIDPPDDIVKVSQYKTTSIAKYTPK